MYAYVLINGEVVEVWLSLERAAARHAALPGSRLFKTILGREVSPIEYMGLQVVMHRDVQEVSSAAIPVA